MTFIDYIAITGWAIVLIQNGFGIARWIIGKVHEAKAIK